MARLIAFDTDVLIYFFEDRKGLGDVVEKILSEVESGHTRAAFSVVGVTELLTLPLRQKKNDLVDFYRNEFQNFPHLSVVSVDIAIAEEAARLRAAYLLKTPDALHLAMAVVVGAEVFYTNDKQLKKVKEIKVELLSEM